MSREAAAAGERSKGRPQVMLDDCRLQLPSDNIFRFCAQNGMPHIRDDVEEVISLRTAAEIEAERLAHKKKTKAI
ncbi:hypothetical protein ACVWZZ_001168 [Bradyrhizobium sp. LM6.10]